jgi:hypothetical protein
LPVQLRARNFLLAKHYNYVMITPVAVDYRDFIKVDEVDGRSLVERAAATFVPDLRRHCIVQTINPPSSSSPLSDRSRLNSLTETSIVKFLIFELQMKSTRNC